MLQPATPLNNSENKFRRFTRTPSELLFDVSRISGPPQGTLQPVDLNKAFCANANNLSNVQEESFSNSNLNGTYVKDSSSKENHIFNDTYVISSTNNISSRKENSLSNATFVIEKPTSNNSSNTSPVDKLSDRMTQSLFVENNNNSNCGNIPTIIRKPSFNGLADLNRVPSAPSLK